MDISKIAIGAMRFPDRQTAINILHKAIDCGFNYIDTSPLYRLESAAENSERWIGAALNANGYRHHVQISTKCATSNGRLGLGQFEPEKGFGVRTAVQLAQVFEQSLQRMALPSVDYYHLWICHTDEQFQEAFKPGGWYDGVQQMRAQGKFQHLGITTHADSDTILSFLQTGHFETVTIPLNVTDTTRLPVVDYCRQHGMAVIAMNPFGGGLLAAHDRLRELALRYLLALDAVHPIIGFTSVAEVEYAKWVLDTMPVNRLTPEAIVAEVDTLLASKEPRCTACGYCQPCPQFINVGAALSYYNLYKYLHLDSAKTAFANARYNLHNCVGCGLCETRCPNGLPVRAMIEDAKALLYV